MPDHAETHRNGLIRLAAGLAILAIVGATVGWRSLLGWPALVLSLDLVVTAALVTRMRGAGRPRRTATRAGVTRLGH